MRIQIETKPIGPLSVLGELPDARLAVVEGRNGIGKSLAVRLLEVCTGVIPYPADSAAWASLRRDLGEFRIQVSGLQGARVIEWVADTRNWGPTADASTLSFKRIQIDSSQASIEDVRRVLSVHRLAGDETLIETLAQQADDAAGVLRRWMRSTTSHSGSPLAHLEHIMENVQGVLGEWTAQRYTDLLSTVQAAQENAKTASIASETAKNRLHKLNEALDLQRRRDDLRRSTPDLELRIRKVDKEIVATRSQIEAAQARIVHLAEKAAKTKPFLRELTLAQNTLKRNRDKLSAALDAAAAAAVDLGVEPTEIAVSAARRALTTQIEDLTAREIAVNVAPALRAMLDVVSSNLIDAESRGLGKQIAIVDLETDLELTVAQARVGVATRQVQLDDQPPPPAATAILEELTVTRRKLGRMDELANLLALVDKHSRLVISNEERVDRALAAADPSAQDELQQMVRQRRALDATLLDLAADRAALRQQLGSLGTATIQVVEARLQAVLRDLGLTEDEIAAAVDTAQKVDIEAQANLAVAQHRTADQRRELARAEADVRRSVRDLIARAEFAWIRTALGPVPASAEHAAVGQLLAAVERVREKVDVVTDRLGRYRGDLAAIEVALRGVGRHLRGQNAMTEAYVPELQGYFSSRFSDWFNSDKVRSELLPRADNPVTVNVREREVSWTENGYRRSRPLEAFSSGEQAFAYTRARLARLDEDVTKPPNRLVVLDEFGAFIAHDRLSGLLSYLKGRVSTHPEDQVLVILPLSHDYASEAMNSMGSQKERLHDLAEQIARQGFGVQVISE